MKTQESFFDRSTITALAILMLSWWGWSSYMKKKYADAPKESVQEQEIQEKIAKGVSKKNKKKEKRKEKVFYFKGEQLSLEISSLGMGVKRAELHNFFDNSRNTIVFNQGKEPLFASLREFEDAPLYFQITKQKNGFVGMHQSEGLALKKTLSIDEKTYRVFVKTQILRHNKDFKGLAFQWEKYLDKKNIEKQPWYLRLFLFSLPESLAGFVFSEEGVSRVFSESIDSEQSEYKAVSVGAIGTKYFGQAFVNKSPLLPSLRFEGEESFIKARLFYELKKTFQKEINYTLFFGPKDISQLKTLHPKAQNWIDYGMFGWLARPLLVLLKFLYSLVHNWGFAIILLTVIVRLLLLPINIKSYRSMKVMQKLQKPIQELKEKYKDKPQELNQRMLALMKENKANPLGGCLPLLLQFPVFFALYRVLGESLELYQSSFGFWITDLSLKDPYYVLPILAGVVLFLQQKLTPMNMQNKAQARILTAMPIVFSIFMLGLPSGLTLYIFISGLFGSAQQFFFVKSKHNN